MERPNRDRMMKAAPDAKVLREYHVTGELGPRTFMAEDIVEATRLYWESEGKSNPTIPTQAEPEKEAEGVN